MYEDSVYEGSRSAPSELDTTHPSRKKRKIDFSKDEELLE